MPALPSIEHLNVLKDLPCCVVTGGIVPMVHELALQCPEEAFDAGVVPTITFAAHAGRDAVAGGVRPLRLRRTGVGGGVVPVLDRSTFDLDPGAGGRLELGFEKLGRRVVAMIGEGDVRPGACKGTGRRRTDATTAAGQESG